MKTSIDFSGVRWRYLSNEGKVWISEKECSILYGDIVKATDKRRVIRLPGVYLKEIKYRGIRRILKTFSGGTACKEGRNSLTLAQKGILIPQVIAFGREDHRGLIQRDILITGEVEDSKRLYDVMLVEYKTFSFHEKKALIRSFAKFIQLLHRNGILHHDLHIGNVLVRRYKNGDWRFFLLDSDRVQFLHGNFRLSKKADNLALILVNFQKISSRTERFRFLRNYLQDEGKDYIDRRFLAAIEKKALKISKKSWHKRALHATKTNSQYKSFKYNNFDVLSNRKLLSDSLTEILCDPDQVLDKNQIVKSGNTVKASILKIDDQKYFLKRYNNKGPFYSLRNAFRASRAVRTWRISWELFFRGIPVPIPLACIEERKLRLLKRSYILYQYIENSFNLSQIWQSLNYQDRKSILIRIALKLGWMHRTGCIHGDLKWNNILTDGEKIHFIDFDGSRLFNFNIKNRKIKDINRFILDLSKYEKDDRLKTVFLNTWKKVAFLDI